MNEQYLLYGLVGIVALFLCIKLLKWPIKNTDKWNNRSCFIICS